MPNKKEAKSRERKEKSIGLSISLALIIIHAFQMITGYQLPAISPSAHHALAPALFQLHHASIFHLMANIWAFITMVFVWRITLRDTLTAYAITIIYGIIYCHLIPPSLNAPPAIGFSAVIYALIGMHCKLTLKSQLTILFWIFMPPLIFSSISLLTHLSAYIMALLLRLISTPAILHKSSYTKTSK